MDREAVFEYIDEHYEDHLENFRALIQQPSISPEDRGVRECAEFLREWYKRLGCTDVALVETSGYPVLYGELNVGAKKTLAVYFMYDTQPADEPTWTVDPLKGVVKDIPPLGECLIGRGAINSKGPLAACLNTIESIKSSGEKLPVNLILLAEGEEELGSRHLPEFIKKYEKRLARADALFFPGADQDQKGKPIIALGCKGIVYFELELAGRDWGKGPIEFDIHGSNKAWVDSPTWRMVKALSTMVSPDGNEVTIDGFYDKVAPLSKEDLQLLEALKDSFDEQSVKELVGVKQFMYNLHGKEALIKYMFSPTLNINGIWSGYIGPGTKTVLPHKITTKVDVRLVPKMEVKEVLPMIRKHLDKHGFSEIKIRDLEEGYPWARTSIKDRGVQSVVKTYREFGKEPEIWPTMAGSGPVAMFTASPLNLPFFGGGLGHGGRYHSPDEYIVVGEGGPTGGLRTLEKSFALILDNYPKT